MAITIGEEGEAAVAYDLELCRMVGAWTGKATAPIRLTPGGEHPTATEELAFTTGEIAGFIRGPALRVPGERAGNQANRADGTPDVAAGVVSATEAPETTWHDPRAGSTGPLPPGEARFEGFYVNRKVTILKWEIGGTEVLELPAYDVVLNGGGYFTRTFHVAQGGPAIRILIAGSPQPDGPVNFPAHKRAEGEVPGLEDKERVMQSTPWVHGDRGEVMIWAAGDPDGSTWRLVNGELALEVPPRAKAATFQIAYWTAPKHDPDGHTAPLFFREPQIDLAALTRGGVWRTIPASDSPAAANSGAK